MNNEHKNNLELRLIFIENTSEGYNEIRRKFNFTEDHTERLILPTNFFFLKKKLNNLCGKKYYELEIEDFGNM